MTQQELDIRQKLSRAYVALVDVMQAVAPDLVDDEKRSRYFLSMMEQWQQMMAAAPGAGFQPSANPQTYVPQAQTAPQPSFTPQTPSAGPAPVAQPQPAPQLLSVVEVMFCNKIDNIDGQFCFSVKRALPLESLMESTFKNYYYKLTVYSDDSVEVTTNDMWQMDANDLNVLKDRFSEKYPNGAVRCQGALDVSSKGVKTVKPGKARKEGRSFVLTEPMEIEIV